MCLKEKGAILLIFFLSKMQGFTSQIVARIRNSFSLLPTIASFHLTSASLTKRKVGSDAKVSGKNCISTVADRSGIHKAYKRWRITYKNNGLHFILNVYTQRPKVERPKTNIRYAVRYKRADAKRALKDILLNGKDCSDRFLGEKKNSVRSKSQKLRSGKGKQNKRWQKHKCFSDDGENEHPEVIFTANFGGQRSFTWSFNTWENKNFESCTTGFQWKDDAKTESNRKRIWSESDIEEEEERSNLDLHYDRIALGLPASGCLCLDDVKKAFRESAMKWHPDKHRGLAQTVAAEKFKLCVDAYNNLCKALKSS